MICNKFKGTNNVSVNVLYFGCPTQQCNKLVIKPVRYVPIHKDKELKEWNQANYDDVTTQLF